MKETPDQDVRNSIARDHHLNMMVEASAGTGKTESLCRRITGTLLRGETASEKMAAITFTRKAAAELRGRLRLVLEREYKESEDVDIKRRCRLALDKLENIFIGTIHSFCSRLLREHPIEAGVVPGFTELENSQYLELLMESLSQTLYDLRRERPDLVQEILGSGIGLKQLLPGFEVVCQQPDVVFEAEDSKPPDPTTVAQALESFMTSLEQLLPDEIAETTTCQIQIRYRRMKYLFEVADAAKPAEITGCLELWRLGLKPVQRCWPGDKSTRKVAAEKAQKLVDDFVTKVATPYLCCRRSYLYSRIVTLYSIARETFARERERTARLDFGDLLRLTARMLRENLTIRESLQSKFHILFVDEFQDTDPLQAEIILLLASNPEYHGNNWREAPLRPGSLFVVGDPKQSIYRFRRADIELFEVVRKRIKACHGESVVLSASFRSTPELCSWTNRVFSRLMPGTATDTQARFSPLEPVRDSKHGDFHDVLVLPTETKRAGNVSSDEAEVIAQRIQEAVSTGNYRYGDFLILTAKRSELSQYYHSLVARGAPVELTGGLPEDWPLTNLFLQLLRALSTPDDGVALVGILRSSLYGLSDQELYQHKVANGRFRIGKANEGEELVVGALEDLLAMRRWVKTLSVAAAAEKILDHTGLLALANSRGDGDASSLLQTVHSLRTLSVQGMSVAQALDALELSEPDFPVSINSGQRDVVRVMNLHQAKGLQARVVFLAAPTAGLSEKVSLRVIKDANTTRGFFSLRDWNRVIAEPSDWDGHETAEREYLLAERVRLLYVASTRAEECLVISRWQGKDGRVSEPWALLYDFVENCSAVDTSLSDELLTSAVEPPPRMDEADSSRVERTVRWAECAEPSWERSSVTALAHEKSNGVVSAPLPSLVEYGPEGGAAWGDLIHRLLEKLAAKPELTDQDLAGLARWYVYYTPELEEHLDQAIATVRSVARSEFWDNVLSSRRLMEVPFGISTDRGRRMVFGVIDLALENESGNWELVDYKTDRKGAQQLLGQYAGQLQQYVEHWESLTQEAASAQLFSVRSGELLDDSGP